jgi:hypothetical protein
MFNPTIQVITGNRFVLRLWTRQVDACLICIEVNICILVFDNPCIALFLEVEFCGRVEIDSLVESFVLLKLEIGHE